MREKRIQIEGQDTQYLVRDDGSIWNEKRHRELKGTIKRNEYQTVYLMHNGKQYNFMVHRLVAEAFCPNPNNYTIVHHKDNNSLNNCADNLEWVTTWENNQVINRKKMKQRQINKWADFTQNWKLLPMDSQYGITDEGYIINFKTGKMSIGNDRNGYKRFKIGEHIYSIHRLVYEAFIGDIPDGMKVDHIDGNRSNNKVSNLRLVTQSENMYAAMANGHGGQIPVLQFDKQGNFIQEFPTIQAAADAINVTHAAVRSAIARNGTCGGYKWKKKSQ